MLVCFGVLLGGLGLVLNVLECSFFLNLVETLRRYAGRGFMVSGYVELILTKMRNRSDATPVDVLCVRVVFEWLS